MKTIQMTIDEPLLEQIDEAAQRLKLARSALMREAMRRLLAEMQEADWDRQHREGYERIPVGPDEFPEADATIWDDL